MKDMIMEKAYQINLSKICEGYFYDDVTCYAENRNKARRILLDSSEAIGMELKYTEDELTYINIPVMRCKELDKLDFEGENKTRNQIENIINKRKRFSKFDEKLNDEAIKYCYIKKHGMYYRPNSSGYTDYISDAGVYDKQAAIASAKSCDDLYLIDIDISEHNKIINDKINKLKTNLIR